MPASDPTAGFISVRTHPRHPSTITTHATERLEAVATALASRRIVHVSSSDAGSAEAEAVRAVVELSQGLGLDCEWRVLAHPRDARIANVADAWLERDGEPPTDEWASWVSLTMRSARALQDAGDVCVVHGTGLAGLPALVADRAGSWLWQPHRVLTGDSVRALERIHRFLGHFDAALTLGRPEHPLPVASIFSTRLAVDPSAAQNKQQGRWADERQLRRLGIDPARQLIARASRFGAWDKLHPLIESYSALKLDRPGLQLVICGRVPTNGVDRVAHAVIEDCLHDDPDAFVHMGPSKPVLGAVRRHASALVQVAEDLPTQLEALEDGWQGQHPLVVERGPDATAPAIGSTASAPAQLRRAIDAHLARPTSTRALGATARRLVSSSHLTSHRLLDELLAIAGVVSARHDAAAVAWG